MSEFNCTTKTIIGQLFGVWHSSEAAVKTTYSGRVVSWSQRNYQRIALYRFQKRIRIFSIHKPTINAKLSEDSVNALQIISLKNKNHVHRLMIPCGSKEMKQSEYFSSH